MPNIGDTKLRYPGGDPENGPAYLQRWDGAKWQCASHRFTDDSPHCHKCGDLNPDWKDPKPEPLATSHAGQHSDGNGPFEVWYSTTMSPVTEPGWYWWSCSPGCMPDGEPQGPYLTSSEAYEHYHGQGSWDVEPLPPGGGPDGQSDFEPDDPNRDGVRLVEGDDLWEGAVAGWYVFKDGDSTGPFDTEAEAYDQTGTDTGSGQ